MSRSRLAQSLVLVLALLAFPAAAQEAQVSSDDVQTDPVVRSEPGAEPDGGEESPAWAGADEVVALDISGAGYYELIAWIRRLGLPETGGADELRRRLYAYYKVAAPETSAQGSTLRIEAADKTEYFQLESVGEEYVRLSGGVVLVFTESESQESHRIQADEVVFNRTTNVLSARGSVEYEKTGPSGTETFYGRSLTVDLDSWQGRFLDGRSVQSSGEGADESTLVFAADEIQKLSGDILSLKDGLITSSTEEDPYWAIRASRIWLLGEKEWVLANAVLSVGNVPVLYLPIFYYPGQEIVFHPAIGYREREGRFVQTTTYLLGEKTSSSDSEDEDSFSFFKTTRAGEGYEKALKGVFLQDTEKSKTTKAKDTLKLLADIYSNLGAYIGLEGLFSPKGAFKDVSFSFGLGFSRSIFSDSGYYTPFSDAGGYASVWNASSLWGVILPFRYYLNLETKLALGPATVSITFPFMSDPFVSGDFRDRSEDINWFKMFSGETTDSSDSTISSYTQKVVLSGNLPVDGLKPWISSVSLNNLTSSIYWKSLDMDDSLEDSDLYKVDPMRKFFAPELFTIADLSLTVKGNLIDFSSSGAELSTKKEKSSGTGAGQKQPEDGGAQADAGEGDAGVKPAEAASKSESGADSKAAESVPAETETSAAGSLPLKKSDELIPPWGDFSEDSEGGPADAASPSGAYDFPPPSPSEASGSSSLSRTAGLSGGVSYTLSPAVTYERRYPTSYWDDPEEVNFQGGLYDLASYKVSGSLETKASWASSLVSSSFALGWTSQAQSRLNIDEDTSHVSSSQRSSWELTDAQYRYERLIGTLKLSSSPFKDLWLWSPTALSYTMVGYLLNTTYQSDSISNYGYAVYDVKGLEWSTDSIKTHNLSFTLGAQPYGYVQSLTFTSTLPPRLESYSMAAKFTIPYVNLQGSTKYYQSAEGADCKWDDFTAKMTAGPDKGPTLTDQFVWSIEDAEPVSNITTFTWGGFSASLSAEQSDAYELSLESGWESVGNEKFRLTTAAASYKKEVDLPMFRTGAVRFKGSLNTTFSLDLLKVTESALAITYGLTIVWPDFLDLTLSGTSQNSSVWRYAPSWFGMSEVDGVTFEPINFLDDLVNSISIWDKSALRRALFKIKGLSIKATHHMKDWDLVFEYKGEPDLNTSNSPYTYEFVSSFSLVLTWKAIPQITSSVIKDDTGFRTE